MLRLYPPGSQTRDTPSTAAQPSLPGLPAHAIPTRRKLGLQAPRAGHPHAPPTRSELPQHQRRSPDRPARSPPTRSAPPRDPGPLHRQASLVAPGGSPCPMHPTASWSPPRPRRTPLSALGSQGALPAAARTIPVPMARRHEHCPARPRHGFVTATGVPGSRVDASLCRRAAPGRARTRPGLSPEGREPSRRALRALVSQSQTAKSTTL